MNKLLKSIEHERITPFYVSWSQLVDEIVVFHKNRNISAKLEMQQGILIYKALLEQCATDEFVLEPLNNAERLKFIEMNVESYAAFRQLQELFHEMKKKIAAKRAILLKQ